MQWHPTPVLLPGKTHGWRSLVGCSPWGCEELDTTERFHFHFSLSCIGEGMATHSSVLAWRIPGTGEPGGLPSMGSHRVEQLKRHRRSSSSLFISFLICKLRKLLSTLDVFSHSVVSKSLQLYGIYSPRLLCPWNFLGKNAKVACISYSRGSSQPKDRTCVSCISCTDRWILCHQPHLGSPIIHSTQSLMPINI